jgi:N-acetylglucosamine-6-phosphate deacetylase
VAADGAESLGAHCEGPFLSPTKNGIHAVDVLLTASNGFADVEDCYDAVNLKANSESDEPSLPLVRMITAAPELGGITEAIPEIRSRGIIFSIGHSEATFEEASAAVQVGATMITHLFNAMRPLHHRNPGIFGVLGTADTEAAKRPFFGLISDGIHVHPSSVKLAFSMHPEGCILVTDAMHLAGLKDGIYEWTNGERIVKKGPCLTLEGSDKIAGRSVHRYLTCFHPKK